MVLTQDDSQDGEAGAVGLRLVHEVEAGGQHDAARDGVGHGGPLFGQHAHEEKRHLHTAPAPRGQWQHVIAA